MPDDKWMESNPHMVEDCPEERDMTDDARERTVSDWLDIMEKPDATANELHKARHMVERALQEPPGERERFKPASERPHKFLPPNTDYCAICGYDEPHSLHDPDPEPEGEDLPHRCYKCGTVNTIRRDDEGFFCIMPDCDAAWDAPATSESGEEESHYHDTNSICGVPKPNGPPSPLCTRAPNHWGPHSWEEDWGDRGDYSDASDNEVAARLYEIYRRDREAEKNHSVFMLTSFDRDWLREAARRLRRTTSESGEEPPGGEPIVPLNGVVGRMSSAIEELRWCLKDVDAICKAVPRRAPDEGVGEICPECGHYWKRHSDDGCQMQIAQDNIGTRRCDCLRIRRGGDPDA